MEAGPRDLAEVAGRLADRARLLATRAAAGEAAAAAVLNPVASALEGPPDLAMVPLAEELGTLAGAVLRLAVARARERA